MPSANKIVIKREKTHQFTGDVAKWPEEIDTCIEGAGSRDNTEEEIRTGQIHYETEKGENRGEEKGRTCS